MQNNVSGNTILASLTPPSANAGRDATSARKETREPGASFRDSMEQVARLKVDARRDQLAARADKLNEKRADQQARASASESRTATAPQKRSSDQPVPAQPQHKVRSINAHEPASRPADDTPQAANAATGEMQAESTKTDPASASGVEQLVSAEDALAVIDEEAILEEVDSEAIAPLLAEAGLIHVNGMNLPLTENGLAGFAKASGLSTSEALKDGMAGGFLFGGDSSGSGKTGVGNMASAMFNSVEVTEDGLSLDGDLKLEESGSSFSKLFTASREAHALLEPASAKPPLAAVTSLVEAAPRLVETAAVSRSFVVQTGVPTGMGQPGWSQAVGEKVLWLAAQNLSSAEIRLDPPELGPMQVRITIQNDQANVSFSSPHLVVREALDQSASRLREMFAEQGLNLADVDVSDQSFARQQAREESNSRSGRDGHPELEDETLIGTTDIKAIRLVDHYA